MEQTTARRSKKPTMAPAHVHGRRKNGTRQADTFFKDGVEYLAEQTFREGEYYITKDGVLYLLKNPEKTPYHLEEGILFIQGAPVLRMPLKDIRTLDSEENRFKEKLASLTSHYLLLCYLLVFGVMGWILAALYVFPPFAPEDGLVITAMKLMGEIFVPMVFFYHQLTSFVRKNREKKRALQEEHFMALEKITKKYYPEINVEDLHKYKCLPPLN